MQVRINGKPEEISETNLLALLKLKNIEPQMVSVELNTKMLDRPSLSQTILQEGDQIEFLYFMGGGTTHPPAGGGGPFASLAEMCGHGAKESSQNNFPHLT